MKRRRPRRLRRKRRRNRSDITDFKVTTTESGDPAKPVKRNISYTQWDKRHRISYTTTKAKAAAEDAQVAVADRIAGNIASKVADKLGYVVEVKVDTSYWLLHSRWQRHADYKIGKVVVSVEFGTTDYGWESERGHMLSLPDARDNAFGGSYDINYGLTFTPAGEPKYTGAIVKRIITLLKKAEEKRRKREAADARKAGADARAARLVDTLRSDLSAEPMTVKAANTYDDTARVMVKSRRSNLFAISIEVTHKGVKSIDLDAGARSGEAAIEAMLAVSRALDLVAHSIDSCCAAGYQTREAM